MHVQEVHIVGLELTGLDLLEKANYLFEALGLAEFVDYSGNMLKPAKLVFSGYSKLDDVLGRVNHILDIY